MRLRTWQQKIIDYFPSIIRQYRRFILKAPTGAGKTVLASEIIERFYKGKKIIVLCHRLVLLEQLEKALGKKHIVRKLRVSDTEPAFEDYDILLSTNLRAMEVLADAVPKADLIIVDEAHRVSPNGTGYNRHFPANLQIHGNRIYIAPPRELHSLRSPPMTRLWRADHVRKAIWQRFPPSRHTAPVFSTLPSISSAYAGTGLRRRSSIKAKIFWNKIFDTATSASWNVT